MREDDQNWSACVTRESDALDLERGVFLREDPRQIALCLQRSAEGSRRWKSSPSRSGQPMLVFYFNRADLRLNRQQKTVLEAAKTELHKLYGRI